MANSSVENAAILAKKVDYSDYIILAVVAIATLAWFTKGKLWSKAKTEAVRVSSAPKSTSTRDIVRKMRDSVSQENTL